MSEPGPSESIRTGRRAGPVHGSGPAGVLGALPRDSCGATVLKACLRGRSAKLQVHNVFHEKLSSVDSGTPSLRSAHSAIAAPLLPIAAGGSAAGPVGRCPSMKRNSDPDLRGSGCERYSPFMRKTHPKDLETRWIQMDALSNVSSHPTFLEARRSLLADAASPHLACQHLVHAGGRRVHGVGRPRRGSPKTDSLARPTPPS